MKIDYESYIPQSSKLVGKTVGEIEKRFKLKISHMHRGAIVAETRFFPEVNTVLEAGMAIKIENVDSEKRARFVREMDMP
jgi:hypothetical protein